MDKVMRFDIADYLGISETGESEPTYEFMGVGFNTLNESPSAQVDTKSYVCDRSTSSTITGYQGQFSYDSDYVVNEKPIKHLYKIGSGQLTGSDAEVDYVRVDLFDKVGETGSVFRARHFRCAVEVSEISGDGAQPIKMSGNLHQIGDLVEGTFDTTTKKFTAGTTPAAP